MVKKKKKTNKQTNNHKDAKLTYSTKAMIQYVGKKKKKSMIHYFPVPINLIEIEEVFILAIELLRGTLKTSLAYHENEK